MIINWFPFRSLAIIRPINWWPKYTTHTSASYTPANWNFKVKAGHVFPKFGLLNPRKMPTKAILTFWATTCWRYPWARPFCTMFGPQLFIQENISHLLHHFSTVSWQIHGETPQFGCNFEPTLEPDPGALCGRGLLRAPTTSLLASSVPAPAPPILSFYPPAKTIRQKRISHICENLKIDFFHFHQDFQYPPEGPD